MTDRDGGRPRAARQVGAGVLIAAMMWSPAAPAAAAFGANDPVTIENVPSQSSVAIVPEDAPPSATPPARPDRPQAASAPPASAPAPVAPVQAAPPGMPASSAPVPPNPAAPVQAAPPAAPPPAASAPPATPIQAAPEPAAVPPLRRHWPRPAGPAPVVTRTIQSVERPDGSVATVTTTTETVITPPPHAAFDASAIPVQSFAAHREGTLWRIAPRDGGNARLARLDLNQVGVEAHLAEQATAGHATLLLAGRLVRDRGHRTPTLMVTAVEGGAPDR